MSSYVLARVSRRTALKVGAVLAVGSFGGAIVLAKEKKSKKKSRGIDSIAKPFDVPSRDKQVEELKTKEFDVLVIGGGATGAGCVLDAATRGLDVAIVEASDFSAGTSGRSTKLIHGGVRYLEAAFKRLDYKAFKLVLESLEERAFMLGVAPFMNHPLPIMIPIYRWWEVPYMWVGTKMYDMIAGGSKSGVPGSYYISADETMHQYPQLKSKNLKGALVYYDGQMNDTRMNLSLVLTAIKNGASAANYVEVLNLIKDKKGKVRGAHVRDKNTGEEFDIHAKAVVNATGPFTDSIRLMDDPKKPKIVVPSAGVHLILPDNLCPKQMGMIIPETKDGRVLFFLPWENATLAGTTDTETELTMSPQATKTDVEFILDEANRYLQREVKESDVKSVWSGIRPLVKDPRYTNTSKISREHVVEVSESNMVTIAGGKWTTYRRMAQDAIDAITKAVPEVGKKASSCKTKNVPVLGADRMGKCTRETYDEITVALREKYKLDKDIAEHLVLNYGTRALQVAEIEKAGFLDRKPTDHPRRLYFKYPYLEAEVVFAVKQEFAQKATDVLARRTRMAFIDADAARASTPTVVNIMGEMLGWSAARKQEEIKECEEFVKTMTTA